MGYRYVNEVVAAVHAHAHALEPPPDPSNLTAIIWAAVTAEAATAGSGGGEVG